MHKLTPVLGGKGWTLTVGTSPLACFQTQQWILSGRAVPETVGKKLPRQKPQPCHSLTSEENFSCLCYIVCIRSKLLVHSIFREQGCKGCDYLGREGWRAAIPKATEHTVRWSSLWRKGREKTQKSRVLISLWGGDGVLWEHAGGDGGLGLDGLSGCLLFSFYVLYIGYFKKNYPCNKMSGKSNLKREDFILACSLEI